MSCSRDDLRAGVVTAKGWKRDDADVGCASRRRWQAAILGYVTAALVAAATVWPAGSAGQSESGPRWLAAVEAPSRVEAGEGFFYRVAVRNVGSAATDGTGSLDVTFPAGVTGVSVEGMFGAGFPPVRWSCTPPAGASSVHCEAPGLFPEGPIGPESRSDEELVFHVVADPGASGAGAARFTLSGGGAAAATGIEEPLTFGSVPDFGVLALDGGAFDADGAAFTQAGGHPDSASVTFELDKVFNRGMLESDGGNLRDVRVDLPSGLLGNPGAMPECEKSLKIANSNQALVSGFDPNPFCPVNSIVGMADTTIVTNIGTLRRFVVPVFNLQPAPGVPAQLGFSFSNQYVTLDAHVRTDGDHGVSITTRDAPQGKTVVASSVTLWGAPADHSHDYQRCLVLYDPQGGGTVEEGAPQPGCEHPSGAPWLAPSSANVDKQAFLSNPTACTPAGVGLETRLHVESWDLAGGTGDASFISHLAPGLPLPLADWGAPAGPDGCERVPFDPKLELEAHSTKADSPTGLSMRLSFPQDGLSNPGGLATGHLKRATLVLPQGWSVSPSAADGLQGCTDAQSRVGTLLGAACPQASKIGTVEATTPLLEERLTGGVYVGSQESDDPLSGRMFRMFIALNSEERGIRIKLPGQIRIDPDTGRVEATFDNNPQLPASSITLLLDDGPRAPLATPLECGTKQATAELEAWSGTVVRRTADLEIDCPGAGPLRPSFSAGVTSNFAGRHSTFVLRADRPDRQQPMNGLALRMPTGLLAKLKGVVRCDDQAANAGTCPEASRVGTAIVGAGPGTNPFFLDGGVYLTGPYKRGPFGLVAIVHVKAGPFDLGKVVVRQQLVVDPVDAHVDVVSDPLPTILKGVPVRLRSLNVDVDRKNFVLNPTSCRAKTILAAFGSPDGSVFNATAPFGVANCAALPLKPKLEIALTGKGQTTTGKHPGVKATLAQRPGDANLKRVAVRLPLSLALDPDNAQALCEFKDGTAVDPRCPKGSIIGRARATTPILDRPLTAPIYFVKNIRIDPKSGRQIRTLPMLVIPLRGENGIKVNIKGISEVSRSHLVSTFTALPDVPVSRFALTIKGGKNGILVSNANLCVRKQTASTQIDGQNNKPSDRTTTLRTPNCKAKPPRIRSKG